MNILFAADTFASTGTNRDSLKTGHLVTSIHIAKGEVRFYSNLLLTNLKNMEAGLTQKYMAAL